MWAVTGPARRSECVNGTAVLTQIETNKMSISILVTIDINYKEEEQSDNYDDNDYDDNNDP